MMTVSNDLRQIQEGGHPDPIVELLLAELAIGEALYLQHQDLRQPIKIQFASALLETYLPEQIPLQRAQ